MVVPGYKVVLDWLEKGSVLMTVDLYRDLMWLPNPPREFSAQCKALARGPDFGRQARRLATHALDETQLSRLGNVIGDHLDAGGDSCPLVPFKLGILGNGTLDFLGSALVASAARHGLALQYVKGEYEQMLQDAVDGTSAINRFRPDAVLIAVDYRGFPFAATPGNAAAAETTVQNATDFLNAIRAGLKRNGVDVCILQTLAPPAETLFGSFDLGLPGTIRQLINSFNDRIVEATQSSNDLLLDVAALAETVGLAEWHSPEQWNIGKLPFADAYVPLYAEHVARMIGALKGKSRRCLVLDLDNTLWGGVVGDDGLDGINIAQGDATGEAHLSVQRMALMLRERGVVLAVSSKNTDSIAREVFKSHPEMILKEDHIAVFQANWEDKATNIMAISRELSLGLDAMVFLDDNPVERGLVREMIPEVAVPELTDDPALFARTLAAAGYFESVAFSDEDRKRAEMYQDNARRLGLEQQSVDVESYLASLDMQIVFKPFDDIGRSRIAQLVSKSNQFNLTTRRYTEADIGALERDPGVMTMQVRLIDRFGDNGMISVVICRLTEEGAWIIDTWLMSCRVLGRRVEQAVLSEIIDAARRANIDRLIGVYKPTDRNEIVSAHYAKLGFTQIDDVDAEDPSDTRWLLSTATKIEAPPMIVVRDFPIAVAVPDDSRDSSSRPVMATM